MSFLKSAALFAIDTVTKVDSPRAVAAVRGIIFEYAHHVSPDDQPAKKDFFKVIDHACKVVMDTQRLDHSAKFLVEMLHGLNVNVPDKLLNSSSTDYDQDVVVLALYDVANDKKDSLTLDRAFSAFLQIGTWSAYDHAIDLMGKQDEYAEKLIDQILHNAPDNKISLLENCMRVNRSAPVQKKVFAALCELSKSEDAIVAEDAQDVAVEMFYDRKEDGQYLNIADLAPVLEEVAQKTHSPQSLMPLFAEVVYPENGLQDFVEARFFRKHSPNSEKPDTTINLMAVFERIDTRNREKGYPTSLSRIYGLLKDTVSTREKMLDQVDRLYGEVFSFEKK